MRNRFAAIVLLVLAMVCVAAYAAPVPKAQPFKPGCTLPFDAIAQRNLPIDDGRCLAGGNANAAPPNGKNQKAQNEAKNNFCAPAPAVDLAQADFVDLQAAAVAQHIPFGGESQLPPDRTKLVKLSKTAGGTEIGEGTQVRFVAFVDKAHYSDVDKGESVNCNIPGESTNDIHIPLLQTKTGSECDSVTAEMSPHMRPAFWTPANLNRLGVPVRVTGQLFFDAAHKPCKNGTGSPARVSLWEIHPVYAFDVCKQAEIGQCRAEQENDWVSLTQWVHDHPAH